MSPRPSEQRRRQSGARARRSQAHDLLARVVHTFRGYLNPKCTICGRTPMQAQNAPLAPCRRATLPFEELPVMKVPPKKGTAV